MLNKYKVLIALGLIIGLQTSSFAQEVMKCASKPAQLKTLMRVLATDMTTQLQALDYQGIKIGITARKMSVSASLSVPKTGENFGLGVVMSKDSNGKPQYTLNHQAIPTAVTCTYGYRFIFRIRYLNSDSRFVSLASAPIDYNIQSLILYSNDVK